MAAQACNSCTVESEARRIWGWGDTGLGRERGSGGDKVERSGRGPQPSSFGLRTCGSGCRQSYMCLDFTSVLPVQNSLLKEFNVFVIQLNYLKEAFTFYLKGNFSFQSWIFLGGGLDFFIFKRCVSLKKLKMCCQEISFKVRIMIVYDTSQDCAVFLQS